MLKNQLLAAEDIAFNVGIISNYSLSETPSRLQIGKLLLEMWATGIAAIERAVKLKNVPPLIHNNQFVRIDHLRSVA